MKIIPASELTFPLIQQFIQNYEYSCVLLASHVRKGDNNIFMISKGDDVKKPDDIFGVFYFDKILLHCLPFCVEASTDCEFSKVLLDFLNGKLLKCINGEAKGTDFILGCLNSIGIEPFQKNIYKLMILEKAPLMAPEALSCDDEIRRCREEDFEALFDLQKMYIAKEVAPAGKPVSDAECSISLRQILKNQLCFAMFSNEEVVSKANTNAIGWNWVQIGGVFTHPLYRKNYYAWNLVYVLCTRIQKTQRKICLFVKEKNNPALSLYSNLGFKEKSGFSICYFQ